MESATPRGDITTVMDRADRDPQDQFLFPIESTQTWFTRNTDRRTTPATPFIQEFAPRGPVAFGQTFSFEIGANSAGDLLQAVMLQTRLTSWLDPQVIFNLQAENAAYRDPTDAWYYANSLGTALIDWAEIQVDGVTIERITGDFAYVVSALFPDLNTQSTMRFESTYRFSYNELVTWPQRCPFPTETGTVSILFPFFFTRTRLKQSFPLLSCKEGSVRIMIKLRSFDQIVRSQKLTRISCDSTPLGETFNLYSPRSAFDNSYTKTASPTIPQLNDVRLVTYSSVLNGQVRQALLRKPWELMYRQVQQFNFTEPITYKSSQLGNNKIQLQLDLEANHPLEEIIWFIRRKDVQNNNEWTNYSSVIEAEYDATYNPPQSLLAYARIQVNGIELIAAEGDYFRQDLAKKHRGGITAYNSFLYGYTMAKFPGEHQPSGTLNASRMNTLRLTCDVKSSNEVEIMVFCLGLNWLRFENGMANNLFTD